ncbi:MAG: hypothetical protein M0R40_03820 [Firmicutes bacterium]|nr:hypothetical protein [Bacillota bacterium]
MKTENKFVKSIIGKMSLEQKVGALLTLGFAGTLVREHIYENITKYHCGGLRLTPHSRLFGNYVDPKTGKSIVNVVDSKGYKKGLKPPVTTAEEYKRILLELQELAMSRPLGLPLHFSFDQEGGTSADYSFGGVNIFPKPMGITATGDPQLAYEVALAVSRQARAVGFNWIHSPVLDVNTDPLNPEIYTRAYSDNAEVVAQYAALSCHGFVDGKLIATGKHFPSRGDSAVDAHFEIPVINADKETLLNRELLPYIELIKKDLLPSIMLAHSIFPAIDPTDIATVSKPIVTGLLREELGFDGVITTDSMTMGGVAVRYGVANACALSLEAGADLVLMKAENALVGETIEKIKEFVNSGRITPEELDKKVYRVLSLKYKYGLFNQGSIWHESPNCAINSPEIKSLSKLVARRSVMVLNSQEQALPVSGDKKVLVVEQINKTPNNIHWHPGFLFKKCMKYHKNIQYLETAYTFDEDDKKAIEQSINDFDAIVFTSFYIRGSASNCEFLESLIAGTDKEIIIVTNTPYPISIPKNSKNTVLTFATSPDSLEVTAGVLFGATSPEGDYPIEYKLFK